MPSTPLGLENIHMTLFYAIFAVAWGYSAALAELHVPSDTSADL
jgi:hypothetical protein